MIELIRSLWPYVLGGVDIALAVGVTFDAVLRKRDTRAVIGWVGLAWLAPFVGSLAYLFFGINRIRRKAASLQIGQGLPQEIGPPLSEEDYRIRDELLSKCPNLSGLAELGKSITQKSLLPGNTVKILLNGDEAYPAMLDAIAGAKKSVALLSYIFDHDHAGEAFVAALQQAKMRGVEVRVLIDYVGARYSKPSMVSRLRREGIKVAAFLPTRRPWFMRYANLRNHRKILVVDGETGFTGGTNIREGHWLALNPSSPVQCVHFQLDGPVVAELQHTFAVDWLFAYGEVIQGHRWFPELERAGLVGARGIPDGPDEDFEKVSEVMLGAIAIASRSIRIATPYFLPDAAIIRALNVAAGRGIQVDIIIPGKNNVALVQWATFGQLDQLLEKGCRICTSRPPFDHTKLMVIDSVWSLIGSTNWDPRSLRLNFEFNVECYGTGLAIQLEKLVDEKIANGKPITLSQLNSRTLPIRIRDGLARLASPYL